MRACYELAFSVNCSSTMLAREKPLFTGCVEEEYGEIPLNGLLRSSGCHVELYERPEPLYRGTPAQER
jgi:hypothetical protein